MTRDAAVQMTVLTIRTNSFLQSITIVMYQYHVLVKQIHRVDDVDDVVIDDDDDDDDDGREQASDSITPWAIDAQWYALCRVQPALVTMKVSVVFRVLSVVY